MRILLIEDDATTAAYVERALSECGYLIEHVGDGRDGLFRATDGGYSLVILDRMLPGLDGLSVVQALRAAGIPTPVLILSALGQVDDRVKGLRAGGDDYLTKPFAFAELLARVEALLRRKSAPPQEVTRLTLGDLEMDLLRRAARRKADRPETARVPAARISAAPCRTGRHAHHVAGRRLGLSLRSADQRDR